MISIKTRLLNLKPSTTKPKPRTDKDKELENKRLEYVSNGFISLRDKVLKKPFMIDDNNMPTIIFLHYYFSNVEYIFKKQYPNHNLEKGLLLTGKCGTGKTALLRIFKNIVLYNKEMSFTITSANEVVREYDSAGSECLTKYIERKYLFDDFGSENQGKHYGKNEEVFKTLIEERYNKYIQTGLRTHLTSNLTINQIKERYGERVSSRLKEMFNIIVLDGNDRRI